MLFEDALPASVPQFARSLGRVHNVGEHHRCENSIRLNIGAGAGEEFFDFICDLVGIPNPQGVVYPRHLNVFRARNLAPR